MDKHIEYFETKQEYLAKESELPRPSVSYTVDTKDVFYKGEIEETLRMWLDDFPNEAQETYELEDFVNNPETCGSNPYVYSGDTFEYEGEEYYLWKYVGEWDISNDFRPYALTTSNDFSTLYQESLESNLQNIDAFPSLYAYFWGNNHYINGEDDFNGTLVKVERVE